MLRLNPPPTFAAKVQIPVPGAPPAQVTFHFKCFTVTEMRSYFARHASDDPAITDRSAVAEIVTGWEAADVEGTQFSDDALATLLDNYHGAPLAIMQCWRKRHVEGGEA